MTRLTPAELQEMNRFLEAGKPLPDKYRFLLFDDKREVELVWNGKTTEVTNAVLPFQVIEQVDEPRAEVDTKLQMSMFDVDERGRQLKGWQYKLICDDINALQTKVKYDFVYVDQEGFEKYKPDTLKELVSGFREYK